MPSPFIAHAPRRFLVVLFGLLAAGMAGTAVVNVVVDPWDVLRVVDHPALVALLPTRPAQVGRDRLHKAHLVRSERPDGLLLGTSRAQVMLDPESPRLRSPGAHGASHVVNAAVNGAQPWEALRLFQHAQALRPQRLLVYGLDMLAFDAGGKVPDDFREDRLAVDADGRPQPLSAWADVGATVLSEDALRAAVSTIRRRHEPSYLRRLGMREPRFQEEERARAGGAHAYFLASERDYLGNYACSHPFAIRTGPRPDDDVEAPKPLADLARLLEAARAAGTRVRLYVSPVHARHMEVIEAAGLKDAQDRWKGALVALVADFRARGLDVELWDFQGVPGLHDEPPGGPSWWESSHATAAVGEQVLAALLGDAPEGFGARLEPATWRQTVARIRALTAAWEPAHPDEAQEIQSLAAEVLPAARRERGCASALAAPPEAPPQQM